MSLRIVAAVIVLAAASVASADPRPFVFSNDTYPMGKGDWEYEQWAEWRTHKEEESGYDRVDFRHEFEFGITDTFDLAFYLPNWSYEDSEAATGTSFGGVSVEAIAYLSNPVTDPVGLALYNEITVAEDELEFEQKILVQKDVGNWIFLYNLVLETEIEHIFDNDEETKVEGVIKHSAGVSYAVAPGWFVGGEIFAESAFADWAEYEHTTVYAGPAISYQGHERVWLTITPTYQLSDVESEPDWRIRAILGIQF